MVVPGVLLLVLRFLFSRFKTRHGLVLVSAHSNLLIQIYQCDLGGIFWLSGQEIFGGIVKILDFVLVATFYLPEIGIYISLIVL